jgi:hypothetical protein
MGTLKEIVWWLVMGPNAVLSVMCALAMVGMVLLALAQYVREQLRKPVVRFSALAIALTLAVTAGAYGKAFWDKRDRAPDTWTPEAREEFRSGLLDEEAQQALLQQKGPAAFLLSKQEDREAFTDCVVKRLMEDFPGGPAELLGLPEQTRRLKTNQAGADCLDALAQRSLEIWSDQFVSMYVSGCVKKRGEAQRPWCECMGDAATKEFVNPAEFMRVNDALSDHQNLSAKDRGTVEAVMRRCPPRQ